MDNIILDMDNIMLDDEDTGKLLMMFQNVRGKQGFSEDEANVLLKWAGEVVMNYTLFSLVIDGHVQMDVNEKSEVVFSITDSGMEQVEDSLDDIPPQSNLLQ
jgi:hypothetical protein